MGRAGEDVVALRWALLLTLVLAGCAFLRTGPAQICDGVARDYGPEFRVVGSFATTVGKIRSLEPGATPARWPELAAGQDAVLCYVDGPVPKSLPGGDPFDRAVIAIAPGHSELIMAGYQDRLPVRAP
jgi:hypothetical protein